MNACTQLAMWCLADAPELLQHATAALHALSEVRGMCKPHEDDEPLDVNALDE